jgi:hypothetical protein
MRENSQGMLDTQLASRYEQNLKEVMSEHCGGEILRWSHAKNSPTSMKRESGEHSVSISTNQGFIASGSETLEYLDGLPSPPDMFFSDSYLVVSTPSVEILFSARHAIQYCRIEIEKIESPVNGLSRVPCCLMSNDARLKHLNRLKVKHTQAWQSSRDLTDIPQLETNHDWTFTTTYWGDISSRKESSVIRRIHNKQCTNTFFPLEKLTNTTLPIITFKEVTFWEDELDDNGHSEFTVRVREMEDFVFIMSTFSLRVDGVLGCRKIESRIYYDLETSRILREFKWIEDGVLIPELWEQETLVV